MIKWAFLLFILVLISNLGQAQVKDVVDSIAIFKVVSDDMNPNARLIKEHGYISNIIPTSDGGFDIWLFKQHMGYFLPQNPTKLLKQEVAWLPGMTHLRYENDKLSLKKERIFSLSRNQDPPMNYELLDITSLKAGVATRGKQVLSNDEMAGDYGKLLQLNPQAIKFKKVHSIEYQYSLTSKTDLIITRHVVTFDPYIGKNMINDKLTTTKKVNYEGGNSKMIGWKKAEDQSIIYLAKTDKNGARMLKVDTTGKISTITTIDVPNATFLSFTESIEPNPDSLVNFFTTIKKEQDLNLLYAKCDGTGVKCTDYTLVKVGTDGQVKSKQTFQSPDPEMVFFAVNMFANDTETLIKLTLRKGLLKYHPYLIKINADGVVYQTKLELGDAKVITSDGKPMMGGASEELFLISLPNKQNLVLGRNFGLNSRTDRSNQGGFKGYGLTHLDANGNLIDFYQGVSFMPADLAEHVSNLTWSLMPDGRILLMCLEGRNNLVANHQQFSNLERYFSENQQLVVNQGKDSTYNLYLKERVLSKSSLLNELKRPNILGQSNLATPNPYFMLDTKLVAITPVYYIVDLAKKSIKNYTMGNKGYALNTVENSVWYNKKSNELTTFLRTFDLPVNRSKRGLDMPREVLLKSIKFKLNEM